jgi:hypothetical protein
MEEENGNLLKYKMKHSLKKRRKMKDGSTQFLSAM